MEEVLIKMERAMWGGMSFELRVLDNCWKCGWTVFHKVLENDTEVLFLCEECGWHRIERKSTSSLWGF
jgi:predicted  nucleic acid-binding Zn-ribbon protein